MSRYLFTVFSDAIPGGDEVYNAWYNDQHLGDVLKVDGFVAAQRFKLAATAPEGTHKYLAIYEMETDDPQATLKKLFAAAQSMYMAPEIDKANVQTRLYQPVIPRLEA
jgi:hypothetical protein